MYEPSWCESIGCAQYRNCGNTPCEIGEAACRKQHRIARAELKDDEACLSCEEALTCTETAEQCHGLPATWEERRRETDRW